MKTTVSIRPELMRFATEMELVLRENDHKGNTADGFRPDEMLERLWDEIRELDRESWGHPNITTSKAKFNKMRKEAVDIANFALLYWLGCWDFQVKASD